MSETGRVLLVNTIPLGDELAEPAPIGVTSLTLTSAVDFAEDGGHLYYAEAEVIEYLSADEETGVVTLAAPTTVEGFEGDTVHVWDTDESAVSHEVVAHVALEGEDFDSDAMEAIVPHSLIPYLSEGVRATETEYVSLEWRDDSLYVLDIIHREPLFDSAYLPPSEAEAANSVYRGTTPPWENGDSTKTDSDGDLWYDTSEITNEDGTTTPGFHPYMWDGVALEWIDARDPELDLVSTIVTDNETRLNDLDTRVENVSETATKARDLASTADGRVSFSDYDPSPDDVTYYATNEDGSLVLDDLGNPVLLTRNQGSVWFTRTRARINHCTNPSFEVDAAGWATVAATWTRVEPTTTSPVDGTFALRVANDTTTGGSAEWAGGSPGLAVSPGQTWAVSTFVLLESGTGTGAYAGARFYDSAGVLIEEQTGATVDLLTDDWQEVEVSGTAPDLAAFMVSVFYNPNASDVWLIDGVMVEQAEYTGRYFDGNSYDASWSDTPHASTSIMEGGKIVTVFELHDSGWNRLDFTGSTQYDADASDLSKGTLDPERLADHSIPVEKQKTNVVKASETLYAGDLVNVWDNNGLFFVRRANAASGYEAHGFILADAATGDAVYVHTTGYNPLCSDLTPGSQFLATSPGGVTHNSPSSPGRIVQKVGVASDTTTLHFNPAPAIRLT